MTIYPNGAPKGLVYKWDIAAIDVPVPDDLMSEDHRTEWRTYLECLSPAQLVKKFAASLDQFHDAFFAAGDLDNLNDQETEKLISKWAATQIASAVVYNRLNFMPSKEEVENNGRKFYLSDTERSIFFVAHFLGAVSSPEVPSWAARRAFHRQATTEQFSRILHEWLYGDKKKGPSSGGPSAPQP